MKALLLSTLILTGMTSVMAADAGSATITNVTIPEAAQLVSDHKVTVLDVRTPEEFSSGHIAGATNLNFFESGFQARLKGLDKSKPYLVHCAVGGRSAKVVSQMKEIGFTRIYHMKDGMKGWERAGKPVQKLTPPRPPGTPAAPGK